MRKHRSWFGLYRCTNTVGFLLFWAVEGCELRTVAIIAIGLTLDIVTTRSLNASIAGRPFRLDRLEDDKALLSSESILFATWMVVSLLLLLVPWKLWSDALSRSIAFTLTGALAYVFPPGFRDAAALMARHGPAGLELRGALFYSECWIFFVAILGMYCSVLARSSVDRALRTMIVGSIRTGRSYRFYKIGRIAWYMSIMLITFFFVDFTSYQNGKVPPMEFGITPLPPLVMFVVSLQACMGCLVGLGLNLHMIGRRLDSPSSCALSDGVIERGDPDRMLEPSDVHYR